MSQKQPSLQRVLHALRDVSVAMAVEADEDAAAEHLERAMELVAELLKVTESAQSRHDYLVALAMEGWKRAIDPRVTTWSEVEKIMRDRMGHAAQVWDADVDDRKAGGA